MTKVWVALAVATRAFEVAGPRRGRGAGAGLAAKALFSFEDARAMVRSQGFISEEEYKQYDCPGPYRAPKDPEAAYPSDFVDWGDWLGTPLDFVEARSVVRSLGLEDEAAYEAYLRGPPRDDEENAAGASSARSTHGAGLKRRGGGVWCPRLPPRPDAFYPEWQGWADWLGTVK